MESIREIAQKIKYFTQFPPTDMLIVAIIVAVGVTSFGLGRLSAENTKKEPVSIVGVPTQTASVSDSVVTNQDGGGEVVASKNGSKYHFPWCGGAQRIAEKNLVSFESIEKAQQAGYTPAANCKGLE